MRDIDARGRTGEVIVRLTDVWERSVRATHLFLSDLEIAEIKPCVSAALQEVPHLIVAEDEGGLPVGFMGVEGGRLEMLFVSPEHRGEGIGKNLVRYGIEAFSIGEVTVNEQNPQAVGFYERMGFAVYKRTDLDEQGRPYPLLYMKRRTSLAP